MNDLVVGESRASENKSREKNGRFRIQNWLLTCDEKDPKLEA